MTSLNYLIITSIKFSKRSIKTDVKEVGYEDVRWIERPQDNI
jgi:hypothetical protein